MQVRSSLFLGGRLRTSLILSLSCLGAFPALASDAFRVWAVSSPAIDSWRSGISLSLNMDVERCKKMYGNKWYAGCAAPAPGIEGQRAEVSMTPQAEGVWRWSSPTTLRFYPKTSLAPQTKYVVSLGALPMSDRLKVSREVSYVTQPQAVSIDKETLWIDPSRKAAHAISVPLRFIWPVNRTEMEKRIHLEPIAKSSGLAFSAPKFVWNASSDEVVVSASILSLGKNNAEAQIRVDGIPRFSWRDGERLVQQTAQSAKPQAASRMSVTGTSRLLDVQSMRIESAYSEQLGREYVLEVKTSLLVKPQDVLGNLDLMVLPEKADEKASRPTRWSVMPAISAKDLERSRKITGELLQPGDELTTVTRIRIPVAAGRGLLAAMKPQLTSDSGLSLNRVRRFILDVPRDRAELNFLQPGHVLPLSASQSVDIHTLGLTKLKWRLERVKEPFFALFAQNATFDDQYSDFDSMSTAAEGSLDLQPGKAGEPVFTSLPLAKMLESAGKPIHGLMRLRLTGFKDGEQAAYSSKIILATDLGIIAKSAADGRMSVFAQKLSSGTAAAGVTVQVLGANGTAVCTSRSNSEGRADLPSLYGLEREKRPVAVIATQGEDIAWLPLGDSSREVDYSGFATGGLHASQNGINASVYSQSGVFMPGAELHFGYLVRRQDWQRLPGNLPLKATLYDPAGMKVLEQNLSVPADGLGTVRWQSRPESRTGAYRLDLAFASGQQAGAVIGSAFARLEEFQPDTLDMKAAVQGGLPRGWLRAAPGRNPTLSVHLDNLYGEPAAQNRVTAALRVAPARLSFAAFPDYTFADETARAGNERSVPLADASTDEKGNVSFSLPLEQMVQATSSALVSLEGFERTGGRAVSRTLSLLISPRDVVLGYKPEGEANNLEYVAQNAKAGLRLLVLDNNLDPVGISGSRVTLSARRYVNSLVSDTQGNFRYESAPVDSEISSSMLNIGKDGALWQMPTSVPGDYLVTVRRPGGEILASIPFTVAGNQLAKPGEALVLPSGELRMKLDKSAYKAAETIRFRISSPFAGTGLATIERDSIVAHAWFKVQPGESVQSIRIPEGFEGKGYVNVSLMRSPDSDALYMKPYAYAAAPFTAAIEKRALRVEMNANESVLPGQTLKVRVKAAQKARVQLFAVDEGVLQLTGYRTPDPLGELLANRALDVTTRQAMDLLMPTHERLLGRIPHFGGGMDAEGGRFLNPFRRKSEPPFAYWSDPIQTESGTAEFSIPVPEYFSGKMRVMAVASSGEGALAAGSSQTFATVRGSLIIKPQLPLAAAPGDEFDGAIVIANTVKGSGEAARVEVAVELPEALELVSGNLSQTLTIAEGKEAVVPFTVSAREVLGDAPVRVNAKIAGSGQSVTRTQSLSIRPLGALRRTESAQPLVLLAEPQTKGSYAVKVPRSLYPYQDRTELSISPARVLAIRSLLDKLDSYPYGCTEQSISRAIPYVVLWDAPELRDKLGLGGAEAKFTERARVAIGRAVDAIRASTSGGTVTLWPGRWGSETAFVTAYAGDFLVLMHEHGLAVPEGLAGSILQELEYAVARTPANLVDARYKTYAAWVLQRDGRIMTGAFNTLESWFVRNAKNWQKDVVSALLADGFSRLRLTRRAAERMPATMQGTSDPYLSSGMALALHAMALKHTGLAKQTDEQLQGGLLDTAFSQSATTIDEAMATRALVELAQADAARSERFAIRCEEGGSASGITIREGMMNALSAPGCTRFSVKGEANADGLWTHLVQQGYDRGPVAVSSHGMEVSRKYLNTLGEQAKSVRLGDMVTVQVCARAPGGTVPNAVITDMLPGGLEAVLERTGGVPAADGLSRFERREDRVIFFAELKPEERCFSYKARATSRGMFALPAVQAEDMYRPAVNAAAGAGRLQVK
ncbi:MAG TPA: hypothetical protein DCZ56_06480 [Sutterella sp.]|nr:hypothetical protein [Sutterella sp.]